MKRLYFDTETTGFPRKTETPLEECPHIVQLAALLIDDDLGEIGCFNAIIRPDGWVISEEVAAIHGITTEKAIACGIPINVAMAVFTQLAYNAAQVIAHNITFDLQLVDYEFRRIDRKNVLAEMAKACTMEGSVDVVRIPPTPAMLRAGRHNFKSPKLIESYQHFFGEEFDGQHDALADVRACARIHRHLIKLESPKP